MERLLRLRPGGPGGLGTRGQFLLELGRHDDALIDLNRSLEQQPDDPGVIYNRACVNALMNQPDEAIGDLRQAIAGDAKYREMARTDSDFDNIRDDPRFQELVGEDEPEQGEEPPEAAGGSE